MSVLSCAVMCHDREGSDRGIWALFAAAVSSDLRSEAPAVRLHFPNLPFAASSRDLNGARGKPAAMAARAIARRLVAQFVRLVSISSNDYRPPYYCSFPRKAMASSTERAHVGGLGVIALAVACGACGGGGGAGGTGGPLLADAGATSGIDESTLLVNLSPAQSTLLCEWIATRIGGYEDYIECNDSQSISSQTYPQCQSEKWMNAPASAEASTSPVCTATVSVAESCINGVVEQKPCTTYPSACLELLACVVEQ
jgi:hypothetical protein